LEIVDAKKLKDYTTICGSAPSEILAMMALRGKAKIIGARGERVRRNVQILEAFFRRHSNCFDWNPPGGGSVCFPGMRVVEDTSAFCEELLEATGIMLVPSRQFQFGSSHVRIGFGRDDLPKVLDQFGRYLERR
jgi:aspartate/methionine/tyrosine aminotransferase